MRHVVVWGLCVAAVGIGCKKKDKPAAEVASAPATVAKDAAAPHPAAPADAAVVVHPDGAAPLDAASVDAAPVDAAAPAVAPAKLRGPTFQVGGGHTDFPSAWACLGNEVRSGTRAQISFTVTFTNALTGAPNPGLQVALCSPNAALTSCTLANPDGSVEASATADASGKAVLSVRLPNLDGFTGMLHAVDPSGAMLPQVVYVKFVEDLHLRIGTLARADVPAIAAATGAALDLTAAGLINGAVLDCNYRPAAGATVTPDLRSSPMKVYYVRGDGLSPTATTTDASGRYFITGAEFAQTGFHLANQAGAPTVGLTVTPNPGTVTTILFPPTL